MDAARTLETVETVDAVIEALGGNADVATLTGRLPKAPSNWRSQGYFPPNTYLVLTGALLQTGKRAPASLWRMTEPREKVAAEAAA